MFTIFIEHTHYTIIPMICCFICSSRGRKSPDGELFGRFGATSRNQEGPNIDSQSVQHDKNRAPTLGKSVLFLFCCSCVRNRPTFSILGRFGLSWVDFESVCLSVSVCHPETTTKQHALAVCAKRLNKNKFTQWWRSFCFCVWDRFWVDVGPLLISPCGPHSSEKVSVGTFSAS